MSKLERAYEEMLMDIEEGMDFATAHEKAVVKFNLSDNSSEKLVELYDEEN